MGRGGQAGGAQEPYGGSMAGVRESSPELATLAI